MGNWYKSKTKVNLIIDVVMLIMLMAIAGLGFLIKYVLVPGYKRNAIYSNDVELYFLGLNRHDWGNIHLWISFIFLALMMFHVILHWKMIVRIFGQLVKGRNPRILIASVTGILSIFLLIAPLFVQPDIAPFLVNNARNNARHDGFTVSNPSGKKEISDNSNKKETPIQHREVKKNDSHSHSYEITDIFGYMSLENAARKYSVPASDLAEALNIPKFRVHEKIGRLKRIYGFEMEVLKNTIKTLRN